MYSLYPWRDKEWFTEQFIQKDKIVNKSIQIRLKQEKSLIYLLQDYNSNPEPSLYPEEGAETIETTQIRSE
ncbi:hypothetical protein BLX88_06950 [Bacillus obstructivus]|nr:hypothetical protein BLX88_06950 [Bacillus obstructivus]